MTRLSENKLVRKKHYTKADDEALLMEINAIVAKRPTYGYRRVAALLNQKREQKVNLKRVYRVMQNAKLLLPSYGPHKPTRTHEGVVATQKSNQRWCSDAFSIQCENGDQVHVAFVIDSCDREVIRYLASTIGIDGQAIRDLMVESLECRFGALKSLPRQIQWLSDNGSCYTARDTVNLGRALGFEICTTPSYSPQSNGLAEAFVKTFKRDYVWYGDLSCATAIMNTLPKWFEDYNERAPHKALKMKSPRQFLRDLSTA